MKMHSGFSIRSLSISVFFLLALTYPVDAQVTFEGCTDFRGLPVASVLDYSVNDVAVASLAPSGAPIIKYNPNALSIYHPKTKMFWYAHECGHHALGHTFGTAHPLVREQQADCWAIRTLRQRSFFSDNDVNIVQSELSRIPFGDWTHLPGPQRAINLSACLGGSSTPRRLPPPSTTDSASTGEECEDRCDNRKARCIEGCTTATCQDRCDTKYDACHDRCYVLPPNIEDLSR